ncbi:MAG: hypothetical protein ABSE59_01830 [Opitutaceae bacterium]
MKKIFLSIIGLLLLAACGTLSTHRESGTNLHRLKKIYVEHRLADGRGVDQLIVQELRRFGYDASCGPLTMTPEDSEAILDYNDQWAWDFSLYMIELDLQVRDAHSGKILATASFRRPSLGGKSPREMVQAVVGPLFERPTSNFEHPTPK